MSITLNLPPHIEDLLHQRAAATRQDLHHTALAVLTLGLSLNDDDFFAALEGIQQGLNDFERGDSSSLEEFVADQNEKYGLALEP